LNKTENFKKPHINLFFALNNIKREKYLKGSLFLKFFDICSNNPGFLFYKFAAGVTKLWTPDEIRRFDGYPYRCLSRGAQMRMREMLYYRSCLKQTFARS
jgi:hypothetical protein